MEWMAEHHLWILLVGGLTTALLVSAYLRTARRDVIIAASVVTLLTLLLVLWSSWVVTPREAVRSTIHALSRALETNDPRQVIDFVASDAPQLRKEAEQKIALFEVRNAVVKQNLDITFPGDRRDEATATFNAVIEGADRGGQLGQQRLPARFVLEMRRQSAGWKVTSYEMLDPLGREPHRDAAL